jgi:hypothetical protein
MNETLNNLPTQLVNFTTLLYTTNPIKETVRVIADGNSTFEMLFSTQEFLKLIDEICGDNFEMKLKPTTLDFGGYYLIDRSGEQINVKRLTPIEVEEKLTVQDLKDDDNLKESNIFEKTIKHNSLQTFVDSFIERKEEKKLLRRKEIRKTY